MNRPSTYTSRDLKAILGEALREEPARPEGMSASELEEAAREAGIDEQQVRRAVHRVEQKRTLRSAVVFVALAGAALTAALILVPPGTLLGGRHSALSLHNEHRQLAFTLEALVPARTDAAPDCRRSPEARFIAGDYCVLQRVRLEPGRRASVALPRSLGPCPQVWVRALSGETLQRSAIFTLPASIEIDHRGRLDQKGVGAPHMHAPPEGDLAGEASCSSK